MVQKSYRAAVGGLSVLLLANCPQPLPPLTYSPVFWELCGASDASKWGRVTLPPQGAAVGHPVPVGLADTV